MPKRLTFGAMLIAALSAAAVPEQAYRFPDTADHVRIAAVDRVSGGEDEAIVVVVIERGYHINANPASMEYLVPTALNVTSEKPLRVIYPDPIRFKPKFTKDILDVYEGTIRIIAEFPKGSLSRERPLIGTLTAQACTEDYCLPPAEIALPGG
jgi:hypothetical protein